MTDKLVMGEDTRFPLTADESNYVQAGNVNKVFSSNALVIN